MTIRTRRHLELLRLSEPLRRYAGELSADVNVSSFLVHQALCDAFAEPVEARSDVALEHSLRRAIYRNFADQPSA